MNAMRLAVNTAAAQTNIANSLAARLLQNTYQIVAFAPETIIAETVHAYEQSEAGNKNQDSHHDQKFQLR